MIRPGRILFIGAVEWIEPFAGSDRANRELGLSSRYRIRVKERFLGLPADTESLAVEGGDGWFHAGHEYLFEIHQLDDGRYGFPLCGETKEVDEGSELIRYLRAWKKGTEPTTLRVIVRSDSYGLQGADVVARGPKGAFEAKSDSRGEALIRDLPPGKYTIAASKENFRADRQPHEEETVEVLPQSCFSASATLTSRSTVGGTLRAHDGQILPEAEVELTPADEVGPDYWTLTDREGNFHFEGVRPGRYWLGTNIQFEKRASSTMPRSYYPGRANRSEAAEITVGGGAQVAGLLLSLPDVGPKRPVRICVVDERGARAVGAAVTDDLDLNFAYGNLLNEPRTDQTGCVSAEGFARARYRISATGADPAREAQSSEAAEIRPGTGPMSVVLVLKKLRVP